MRAKVCSPAPPTDDEGEEQSTGRLQRGLPGLPSLPRNDDEGDQRGHQPERAGGTPWSSAMVAEVMAQRRRSPSPMADGGESSPCDPARKMPLLLGVVLFFLSLLRFPHDHHQQILHRLTGLVRSLVLAILPQIGPQPFVTWGILWSFP